MTTSLPIIHCFQETSFGCGLACWEMLFKGLGLGTNQKTLTRFIKKPDWGTTHEEMTEIANTYFGEYKAKDGWTLNEIEKQLASGRFVILNIWDDFPTDPPDNPDGHYVVLAQISNGMAKIYDPTRANRLYGRKKIYNLPLPELEKRWYDFIDEAKKVKSSHWAICVNPQSLKKLV